MASVAFATVAPLPKAAATRTPKRCRRVPPARAVLPPMRDGRISHAVVLEQAAAAVRAHGGARVTVDFPPERSESRSGTLVARYENNLNFAERLLAQLSPGAQTRVGGEVNIRDNINPQGGGEYLDDDETLTGVRAGGTAVVLNAGVDAATLRQVADIDAVRIVLVNCALDRLSWFDRRATRGALDGFDCAYYCKVVAGAGVLLRAAPRPWTAYVPAGNEWRAVLEADERPKMSAVEAAIRSAAAEARRGKR